MSCSYNVVPILLLATLFPTMAMSLLCSPWALGLTLSITSTDIPDHWVSKQFLHRHFPHGYRDAVWMTNSPHFRYCFTIYSIYVDGFFHLSSPRQSC
ncbi:hypothetical protein V8E53_010391 [Lactarius tabidus]